MQFRASTAMNRPPVRRFERGRDARMCSDELRNVSVEDLLEIAKDKWKSRSLQRSLMDGDSDMANLIFERAEPAFIQLLSDQYGNYLSQKILEHCTDAQFDILYGKVENKLALLSNEVHGTRAVQKFVEESIHRGKSATILASLLEHVESLSRSVTGFHVVVKLVEKLEADEADTVLAKLCYDRESVVSMAKDQWGCCVLKTCVDKARGERLSKIIEAIVNSTLDLVQDPFGNYVVQHVLATTRSYDYVLPSMIERLSDHVLDLCQQKFSSNVLEKVLTTAPESHKNLLIVGVLNAGRMDVHNVVQHLLFHQYGNYVLQQTLAVSRDPYFTTLLEAVTPYVHAILRHMIHGEGPSSAPIPRRGSTTLAPEQAQRLCVKLAKRFPALLEGLDESEKALLTTPQWPGAAIGGGGGLGSQYSMMGMSLPNVQALAGMAGMSGAPGVPGGMPGAGSMPGINPAAGLPLPGSSLPNGYDNYSALLAAAQNNIANAAAAAAAYGGAAAAGAGGYNPMLSAMQAAQAAGAGYPSMQPQAYPGAGVGAANAAATTAAANAVTANAAAAANAAYPGAAGAQAGYSSAAAYPGAASAAGQGAYGAGAAANAYGAAAAAAAQAGYGAAAGAGANQAAASAAYQAGSAGAYAGYPGAAAGAAYPVATGPTGGQAAYGAGAAYPGAGGAASQAAAANAYAGAAGAGAAASAAAGTVGAANPAVYSQADLAAAAALQAAAGSASAALSRWSTSSLKKRGISDTGEGYEETILRL